MRAATLAVAATLIMCVVGLTADDRPKPKTHTGGFDSQVIPAEKFWRFTVRKKGEFAYICTFHPTMTATLRVR